MWKNLSPDLAKIIVVAVISMFASWYDLKGDVRSIKQELTSYHDESTMRFKSLEKTDDQVRDDLRETNRRLNEQLAEIKRGQSAKH